MIDETPAPRRGGRFPDPRGPRARRTRLDRLQIARTGLTLLTAPYLLWQKLRKVARNPHAHANELDPARWQCPLRTGSGGPVRGSPRGRPHVVLVGKGYGELRLLERIDAALRARRPDLRTTWCGQIREFFDGVATSHPHQTTAPIPFDVAPAVTRWLARVKPDVVVLVEQFWRPLLVLGCASAGVRLVAVNAIFRGGKGFASDVGALGRWDARRIAGSFSAVCFQSEEQASLAAACLPTDVPSIVTGNLKMDLESAGVDPAREAWLRSWLHGRGDLPLLAAGSTRRGDEQFVLEAFTAVRAHAPCTLLLGPRQMERMVEIEHLVRRAGFTISRRTAPRPGADVLLLDTMGELAAVYPHAVAAFLGGTLRHRGQNFVEPLLHGLPVSFGPAHVYLAEEQRACEAAGLGTRVERPGDLARHWRQVLAATGPQDGFRARAGEFLERHRGALARTVQVILDQTAASVPAP